MPTTFKHLKPVAKFVEQYDVKVSDLAELEKISKETSAKLEALLESGDIKNEAAKRESYDWQLTLRMIPFRDKKLREQIEQLNSDMMPSVQGLLREVADTILALRKAIFERFRASIAGCVTEENIDVAASSVFPYAKESPLLLSIEFHRNAGSGHGIESARRLLMACEEIQRLAKESPQLVEEPMTAKAS